jgi:hypothetical protein
MANRSRIFDSQLSGDKKIPRQNRETSLLIGNEGSHGENCGWPHQGFEAQLIASPGKGKIVRSRKPETAAQKTP